VAGDVDDQPLPEYCAICLDHGTAGAGWKETPCVHRFHGECLERWLRVHGTCPMCRRPVTVPPPPPAEEEED
uniref:RING-type domain-containing protein n=1 Tax=Oryza brachyantha TaxID=4533 RepID=J3LP96_ORYBR